MLIDMLINSWPRSWRAAVALVAMLGGGWLMLDGLQSLVLPDLSGGTVKFIVGLVITIPAAVCFYRWQYLDGEGRQYHELETINAYHESDRREKRIRNSKATSVFSSHHGVHRPDRSPESKADDF